MRGQPAAKWIGIINKTWPSLAFLAFSLLPLVLNLASLKLDQPFDSTYSPAYQ
jgi:hypothetical protein